MEILILHTNAAQFIGHANPGVGYWWTQTNGLWCLCVPAQPVVDAFWPVFLVTVVILGSLAWLTTRRRKARWT